MTVEDDIIKGVKGLFDKSKKVDKEIADLKQKKELLQLQKEVSDLEGE